MDSSKENIVLVKTELGLYSVDSVTGSRSYNKSPQLKWQKLLANDDPLYEIINCKINEKPEKGKIFQQNLSPRSEINCVRDNDRNTKIEEENVATIERVHLQPQGMAGFPEQSFNARETGITSEKVQNCNKPCMDRLLETEAVVVMYCNYEDLHQLLQTMGIKDIDLKTHDMKNRDKYLIFGLKDKKLFGIPSRKNSDTPRPKLLFRASEGAAHQTGKMDFNFTNVYENDFYRCVGEKTGSGRYSKGDTKSASNINDRRRDLDGDELIRYILDYIKSSNSVSNKSENELSSKEKNSLDVSQVSQRPNSPNYLELQGVKQNTHKRGPSRIPRHVSRNRQMQNSPLANTIDKLEKISNSIFNNKKKTELNFELKDDLNFVQKPGTGDIVQFGSNTCMYGRRSTEEYVPSFFCKENDRYRRKNTITFEEYKKTKAPQVNDLVQNKDDKTSASVSVAPKSEGEMTHILEECQNQEEICYIPSFSNNCSQFGDGRPEDKEKMRKEQISKCKVHTSKSNIENNDVGVHSRRCGTINELNKGRTSDDLAPITSLSSEIVTSSNNYKHDYYRGRQNKIDFSKKLDEEMKEWKKSTSESFTDYIISSNRGRNKTLRGGLLPTDGDEENTPSSQYQTASEDLEVQYWNDGIQIKIPSKNDENKSKIQEKGEKASQNIPSKYGKNTFEISCKSSKEKPKESTEIISSKQEEKEPSPFSLYPSVNLPKSLESINVPLLSSKQFENVTDDKDIDIMVGSGAYGSCYLATSDLLDKEVIIKEFQSGITNDDILHEARVLIHLYDTGYVPECIGIMYPGTITSFDSTLALVQEYYGHGVTLKDLCNKMPKCKEPTKRGWLSIAHQLVTGLEAIHKKHILLNDIKTDNILVDVTRRNYPIRYIDMGNATYKKGYVYPCSKEYLKAYYYLAPEVRKRQPSTPASDIFSLGCLIHGINAKAKVSQLEYIYLECTANNPKDRPKLDDLKRQIFDQ